MNHIRKTMYRKPKNKLEYTKLRPENNTCSTCKYSYSNNGYCVRCEKASEYMVFRGFHTCNKYMKNDL